MPITFLEETRTQAIADAKERFQQQVSELDIELNEDGFEY
jgi:hypothetical protein